MENRTRYTKRMPAKWALALLLLFQFFTFSGFSDVAPSRGSGTQSEWIASFSDVWKKTATFRRARRNLSANYFNTKTLFRRILQRHNNRYLTWLALVCTMCADEPFHPFPLSVRPRGRIEEDRS